MLTDAVLPPDPTRLAAVEEAWASLISSGPLLSSAERLGVITVAREAWAGSGKPEPDAEPLIEAAYWLSVDAGGLTDVAVADWERRGLDRLRYLEAVGVVARLANVDFYARGLGASPPALAGPDTTTPDGGVAPEATITDCWVPTVGPAMAPLVLDALPAEGKALRALHEPMYIPMASIGDGTYADVLTRPQIEYVAARTSYLNECFY